MRMVSILLLLLPVSALAQNNNRSATMLAHERIKEYVTTRLFKGSTYQPVSYGVLNSFKISPSAITWTMRHQFVIVETSKVAGRDSVVNRPYYFVFCLDKKLKVVEAEQTAYSLH